MLYQILSLTGALFSCDTGRSSWTRLARGLNGVLAKTMDRRAFLKRSGVSLGAGAAAAQLPFNLIGEAQAAAEASGGTIEVKRMLTGLVKTLHNT